MVNWKKVKHKERDKLLQRKRSGELIEDLAKEIGMRPTTLGRRLREHAKKYAPSSNELESSVTFKQSDKNHAEAKSEKSPRVKTLGQLLFAAGVDESIWKVQDWGVKKWEVGAKAEWKDIQWKDGKIVDGWAKAEGIQVQDLWSVWARLIRIEPRAITPVIRPIECNVTYNRPDPNRGVLKRIMVLADPHFGFERDIVSGKLEPFHDRAAIDIALQIAEYVQPDRIEMIGDIIDLSLWTDKYVRSPEFEYTTQPSINECHWHLRRFREACPHSHIAIHSGNHDVRMRNHIIKHLRAAYGLRPADDDLPYDILSMERLLALDKLAIEWIGDWPNDKTWIGKNLSLEHGKVVRKGGGSTAREIVSSSDSSNVFGHVHRKEMASRAIHSRSGIRTVTAYSPGCLCRVDGAVPGAGGEYDWHQGIGILDHSNEDLLTIYDIRIMSGNAAWDRHIFAARDTVEQIAEDMPEYNW